MVSTFRAAILFILSLFFHTQKANAEVFDKCALFISQWDETTASWSFMTEQSALLKLLLLVVASGLLGGIYWLLARHKKTIWLKSLPLVAFFVILAFLVSQYFPQSEACSRFSLLKEESMSNGLFWIQIASDLIILTTPLATFGLLVCQLKRTLS